MKTVLLITERFDPTADLIISELRRREVPCVRWNLDQIPTGSTLTYRASNERFDSHIVTDGRTINLADVASIGGGDFNRPAFPPISSVSNVNSRSWNGDWRLWPL
jgi:hypothetical protein